MKKMILMLLILSVFVISCAGNSPEDGTNKPITGNASPSLDKTQLAGGGASASTIAFRTAEAAVVATDPTAIGDVLADSTGETSSGTTPPTELPTGQYSLLKRLYDTVWYKTEEEFDDGLLETETEFIFFNGDSTNGANSMKEVEVENGIVDEPESDDFAELSGEVVLATKIGAGNNNANASVIKGNIVDDDGPEVDYIGLYLRDDKTLYLIDEDTKAEAIAELKKVIANPSIHQDDRYLLSTESAPAN